MNIQWFPGHMAKTKKLIKENVKLTDLVVEVLDARIPYSSQNPQVSELIGDKHRIIALNKCDLADQQINSKWIKYFNEKNIDVFLTDSITKTGIKDLLNQAKNILHKKEELQMKKGRVHRAVKIMVIGVPNVGKSTFINAIANKKIANTSDRPGVTKSKQWIRLNRDFSMLDMPGTLWPKFDNQMIGYNLAFTGTIKDEIMDIQTIAIKLVQKLRKIDESSISNRFKININETDTDHEVFENMAKKRGFILKGGIIDHQRCANIFLDEFRAGLLGRISLEEP